MLIDWINNYYLWIKALHVIAVFAWMAGLLYLPRLFVYHSNAIIGGECDDIFKIMERRLLRAIMNPAMIVAWIFGGFLLYYQYHTGGFSQGWLHTKLLMVVILTVIHHVFAYHRKQFLKGTNKKSHLYYRILNEVPTVCLIVIIICVVVKPF